MPHFLSGPLVSQKQSSVYTRHNLIEGLYWFSVDAVVDLSVND